MKVNKIKLIIIVIILALIIMLIPLLKCEIITFYHKDEFKECIKYSELFDYDSLIIKIIEYGDTNASVYCYSLGNYCSGDLLTFKKDKNNNKIYDIEDIYEWIDYVRKMGIEQSFKSDIRN